MKIVIPDYISRIKPYKAGKPIEEVEREYGIRSSIKLASNENPLGPSPMALEAMQGALADLHRYPDAGAFRLTRKLAEKWDVSGRRIVIGNGSDDIIGMVTRAFLRPGDEAVMTAPSFLMYEITVRSAGALPVMVPLKDMAVDLAAMADAVSEKTRMVFITQPNNPTGLALTKTAFLSFAERIPSDVLIVVDEAYIEFMRDPSGLSSLEIDDLDRPVVTLRTFSKAYGLAGIRVGYGIMPEAVADVLHRVRQPFTVNSLAQVGAVAALEDKAFLSRTLEVVHEGLDYFYKELDRLGCEYYPTEANFFLVQVNNADRIFEQMMLEGVIVRSMSSYGFPDYIRVTVGLPEENRRLINVLKKLLNQS